MFRQSSKTGWCEPPPTLLRLFARLLAGKMVIQAAHECLSQSAEPRKGVSPWSS